MNNIYYTIQFKTQKITMFRFATEWRDSRGNHHRDNAPAITNMLINPRRYRERYFSHGTFIKETDYFPL